MPSAPSPSAESVMVTAAKRPFRASPLLTEQVAEYYVACAGALSLTTHLPRAQPGERGALPGLTLNRSVRGNGLPCDAFRAVLFGSGRSVPCGLNFFENRGLSPADAMKEISVLVSPLFRTDTASFAPRSKTGFLHRANRFTVIKVFFGVFFRASNIFGSAWLFQNIWTTKNPNQIDSDFCFGGRSGARTRDTLIKSQVLYQLS